MKKELSLKYSAPLNELNEGQKMNKSLLAISKTAH
jgi:hypothetical protein